jgi:hypothetical protein
MLQHLRFFSFGLCVVHIGERARACAFCATACLEHILSPLFIGRRAHRFVLLRITARRSLATAAAIIVFKFYREIAGGGWAGE